MKLDRPAVIVALLTPFDDGGRLDTQALQAHVDYLVEAGVSGLMPCGTTGESALLSDEELSEVVRATCAAADGRVPVIAHVGGAGTLPTLALARWAFEHGADAVSAVVPYYYAARGDQIRRHYATLLEGLTGPLYGYTIPERTHNELEPELLRDLIADGMAGLKDSTKSIERHREYAAVVREADATFDLLVGTAALVLEALREGSAGAVLAVSNAHPELCVALVRAVEQGQTEEAERLQGELAQIEREVSEEGTIPALKRRVSDRLGGSYGPALRAPLGSAGAAARGRAG